MDLSEIYAKGKENLLQRDIGFTLGSVETSWVTENNRRVLDRYYFRQCAIDGPASALTDVTVLGLSLKTPIIMSAMTMPIPAVCENGLVKVAQGLKKAGSLMWTGTPIPNELSELVKTGVPLVQNVKPYSDRNKLFRDLDRIQENGVAWIGIEIDAGQGTKIGDRLMARNCAPLSISELIQIRNRVAIPLIFKGILSAEDASRSIDAGADAIMVSNHGGHTLDYLPHPFQMIDEVRRAVEGRIPVFVDGGFRRGSDVLKGLALGADLIGLGRPILYGLAANDAEGVFNVIDRITDELRRIMIMTGSDRVSGIRSNCVVRDKD